MTEREMAAVLLAYANGAQIQMHRILGSGGWVDVSAPLWNFYEWEYRVKPSRTIDDIEPMREAPADGTVYYLPFLTESAITSCAAWGNDGFDQRSLRRGLCYASREDAEIAARAMIALKGGEV